MQVYEEESSATETGATPEPRPFFEDPDSNITVQLGAQVYLHCRVQNLQMRTVSRPVPALIACLGCARLCLASPRFCLAFRLASPAGGSRGRGPAYECSRTCC